MNIPNVFGFISGVLGASGLFSSKNRAIITPISASPDSYDYWFGFHVSDSAGIGWAELVVSSSELPREMRIAIRSSLNETWKIYQ